MRKIVIAILLIQILSCVSMSTYDELLNEHNKLKENYSNLKNNYDSLKEELENLKKTPEYYYKKGIDFFNKKEYNSAFYYFKSVIDKFPHDKLVYSSKEKISYITNLSLSNYNTIVKLVDAEEDIESKVNILDNALLSYYLMDKHYTQLIEMRNTYDKELRDVKTGGYYENQFWCDNLKGVYYRFSDTYDKKYIITGKINNYDSINLSNWFDLKIKIKFYDYCNLYTFDTSRGKLVGERMEYFPSSSFFKFEIWDSVVYGCFVIEIWYKDFKISESSPCKIELSFY